MPSKSLILLWALKGDKGDERYKDFADQYARAMELRLDIMAEDILDIADDSSEDELFTEEGKRVFNGEFAARSRIRIDARKWLMGKLKPKKYGDKVQTEISPGAGVTKFTLTLDAKGGDAKD